MSRFSGSRLKSFKKFKILIHTSRGHNPDVNINFKRRLPVRFLKFHILVFELESKGERNLFQFHDFFQIYTSAVQRFHEKNYINKNKARPLARDQTKNTGTRLRNFYKISIGTI